MLRRGEAVDVSTWRNVRSMEQALYIRQPNTEEEFNLIQKAIEEIGAAENAAPNSLKKTGVINNGNYKQNSRNNRS